MATAPNVSPPPAPAPTVEPTALEQAHINQAMDAAQTAIDAISTITSVSTWALAIIGVGIAAIAIWGWQTLKSGARDTAEQIANDRLDAYIRSEDFAQLMKARVDKAVKSYWQNSVMRKLEELTRDEGDEPPFEEKREEQ